MFEASIYEVQEDPKLWLGFDVPYLNMVWVMPKMVIQPNRMIYISLERF